MVSLAVLIVPLNTIECCSACCFGNRPDDYSNVIENLVLPISRCKCHMKRASCMCPPGFLFLVASALLTLLNDPIDCFGAATISTLSRAFC